MPGLKTLYNEPEDDGETEEETFRDVPENGESAVVREQNIPRHCDVYDGRKRDPEYSNADKSCLWETVSRSHCEFIILTEYNRFLSSFISTHRCRCSQIV